MSNHPNGDPHNNTRPYARLKRSMRGMQPCHLCENALGPILEVDVVHFNHPLARTVDHIIPLSAGGDLLDPLNCLPAHRYCNNVRHARPLDVDPSPRSRRW